MSEQKAVAARNELKESVDIRPLKEFATRLPVSSMFRRIILQENDYVSRKSFAQKLGIWMKILREEIHD